MCLGILSAKSNLLNNCYYIYYVTAVLRSLSVELRILEIKPVALVQFSKYNAPNCRYEALPYFPKIQFFQISKNVLEMERDPSQLSVEL